MWYEPEVCSSVTHPVTSQHVRVHDREVRSTYSDHDNEEWDNGDATKVRHSLGGHCNAIFRATAFR